MSIPISYEEYLEALKGKKVLELASRSGNLQAGFRLTDLYDDTNGEGRLHELNIQTYIATRAIKE